MKKTINIFAKLALAIICFAGVLLVAGCNEKELVNIGLSANIKTQYLLNENIDLNGAKLVLTYSDDSQKELVISGDMITGFDTTTIGERAFAANPNLSVIDDNSGISTCNIVTTNTTINNKKTNTSLTCTTE